MNTKTILGIEFVVAVGVASWAAIKKGYWPFPPTIVKTAIAFSLLGIIGTFSNELAGWLGAGFILANMIRIYQGKNPYTGGIESLNGQNWPYLTLTFDMANPNTQPAAPGAAAGTPNAAPKQQPTVPPTSTLLRPN